MTEAEGRVEAGAETSASGPAGDEVELVDQPVDDATADESAIDVEDDLSVAIRQVGELTNDLQRLQAEYVNYKRRVDRDRDLIKENATYAALAPIVDVLDDIDRAKDSAHQGGGDLEPGFKAVADKLERIVTSVGLTKFGQPGEAFDPTAHEALSHLGADPDVEVTTVKVLAKAGYRIGDRVVRAAQVLVVDPE